MPRHETLRARLDWSYELLPPDAWDAVYAEGAAMSVDETLVYALAAADET